MLNNSPDTPTFGPLKTTNTIKFTRALTNTGTLPAVTTAQDLATNLATQIESDFSSSSTDTSGNEIEFVTTADIIVGAATAANERHGVHVVPNGDPKLVRSGVIGNAPGLDTGNDFYINDLTLNGTAQRRACFSPFFHKGISS